ncbi:MAG TPA: cysteine desulfurase family protein [Acidimicrobiia bacterium]|nr:cysteine desulfurase family protein [Acidimicrobiia bacterium]
MKVPDTLTYLDHAATTPMRPEAVEAMLPFFTEQYANPSGSHRFARSVRQAIDEARDVVAETIACRSGEIVFTGCGTESDNAAISGVLRRHGGTAVCSSVEHHAVLHTVEHSGGRVVGVDSSGRIDQQQLVDAIDGDVSVVSCMAVNNEVGSITDVAVVARIARAANPNVVVHTDAVQAACWLDLRTITPHVDLMSLSGHKFGGPKGIGVLVARTSGAFDPLLIGGGQERERRSGTQNVAGAVALAEALRLTDLERTDENARIGALRDRLVGQLCARLADVRETVPVADKVAGSAHVCIRGIENEALLYLLDEGGVCASAASACAAGAMEPSHVLAAMGIERDWAAGAVRLSLGHTTTQADVDRAIQVVVDAVERIRTFAS